MPQLPPSSNPTNSSPPNSPPADSPPADSPPTGVANPTYSPPADSPPSGVANPLTRLVSLADQRFDTAVALLNAAGLDFSGTGTYVGRFPPFVLINFQILSSSSVPEVASPSQPITVSTAVDVP